MQNVAVMGLGIMGGGIASNLAKKGFPVAVYNRTRAKAEPLAAQGARVADTPRQAAEGADVIISMVGDDEASRGVWTGNDGALAGAKAGAVLVECSTLSLDWTKELAEIAAKRGFPLLDAPVVGSRAAAASGSLRLYVGGDSTVLDKVRPVLEGFSTSATHLGPNGAGATMKLINNMMVAVQVVGLSEGLALAERSGLDMQQVIALILDGATSSPMVKGKMERMTTHNYGLTDFALRWMQKDISYALKLGKALGVPMKAVEAAFEVYQMGRDKGLDDADMSAVAEAVRQM